MTPRQLQILQHALGVDEYGRGRQYRNFFCAGGADEVTCRELVAMGYMRRHATSDAYPYYNCSVTDAGRMAVRAESPRPPTLSRGQRTYRAFLDADCGLTFGEYLKSRGTGACA